MGISNASWFFDFVDIRMRNTVYSYSTRCGEQGKATQGQLGFVVFSSIKTLIEPRSALRTGHLPEPCSDSGQYTSLQV